MQCVILYKYPLIFLKKAQMQYAFSYALFQLRNRIEQNDQNKTHDKLQNISSSKIRKIKLHRLKKHILFIANCLYFSVT